MVERDLWSRLSAARLSAASPRLTVVRLVVLLAADFPQVRSHGALAGGEVLLGDEVQLVLRDLVQILPAGRYHRAYLGEPLADSQFFGGRLGAALHFRTEIQTVTSVALGSRYAVGCQQHLGAGVLTALARFCQSTRHMVDAGRISYFCHTSSAFAEQTAHRADRPFTYVHCQTVSLTDRSFHSLTDLIASVRTPTP